MVICVTQRVIVRTIQVADAPLLTIWKNDSLIREMSIGWETEVTLESQEDDIITSLDNPRDLYLLIVLKDSAKPIGYIRINWLDDSSKFTWLRFGLGEERGKGYAREALKAVITWLFDEKEVHRIDAEVYEFNRASLRLLQAIGFIEDGRRRQAHYQDGKFHDVHVLGMLRTDRTGESAG